MNSNQRVQEGVVKTSLRLEQNMAAQLCYLFWFVTGFVFLLFERENRFVRFHALQSITTSAILIILMAVIYFVPFLQPLSLIAVPLATFLWIFLMFKADTGELFKLPVIGNIIERRLYETEGEDDTSTM